jgi:hypothetical protein
MNVPLKHAHVPFEGELGGGLRVVFQQFVEHDVDTDFMPTINISLEMIESVNKIEQTVKLVGHDVSQPWYRIKSVVVGDKTYEYPGFDDLSIQRDEGQITDETWLAIKKLQQGPSKWTEHGI